ncbi:hypothetical protein EJ06DRAFT_573298 [Trichodelitschia bisporula]|uniref:Uncharacterized protein n=1 Tax=Trichodelitschia bisporula TaxID=703511 RepID=A0A6G1I4U7_9PEZI|nr:hypothetical protein EJ06DRAFT_573298 [Trichodelitschia bisporula]
MPGEVPTRYQCACNECPRKLSNIPFDIDVVSRVDTSTVVEGFEGPTLKLLPPLPPRAKSKIVITGLWPDNAAEDYTYDESELQYKRLASKRWYMRRLDNVIHRMEHKRELRRGGGEVGDTEESNSEESNSDSCSEQQYVHKDKKKVAARLEFRTDNKVDMKMMDPGARKQYLTHCLNGAESCAIESASVMTAPCNGIKETRPCLQDQHWPQSRKARPKPLEKIVFKRQPVVVNPAMRKPLVDWSKAKSPHRPRRPRRELQAPGYVPLESYEEELMCPPPDLSLGSFSLPDLDAASELSRIAAASLTPLLAPTPSGNSQALGKIRSALSVSNFSVGVAS